MVSYMATARIPVHIMYLGHVKKIQGGCSPTATAKDNGRKTKIGSTNYDFILQWLGWALRFRLSGSQNLLFYGLK